MGKNLEDADKLYGEAVDYYYDNKYDEALIRLVEAINISVKLKSWKKAGTYAYAAGAIRDDMDMPLEAIELFRRALDCYTLAGSLDDMSNISARVAIAYKELDADKMIIKYMKKACEFAEKAGNNSNTILALNELSELYSTCDYDAEKERRYTFKLLEATMNGDDKVKVAFAESKLASVLDKSGHGDEALRVIASALSRFATVNVKYSNHYAICLYRYAGILVHHKEYDKAIELYRQALDIFDSLHNDHNRNIAIYDMASAYFENGDVDKAIAVIESNRQAPTGDEDYVKYGYITEAMRQGVNLIIRYPYMDEAEKLADKANSLAASGFYREALTGYLDAISIYEKNDNLVHTNVADYEFRLGHTFVSMGDWEDAISFYQLSRKIFNQFKLNAQVKNCDDVLEELGDNKFRAHCDMVADALELIHEADAAYCDGNADKAIEYYNKFIAQYVITTVLDNRYYAYVFLRMYMIHKAMKDNSYITDIENAVGYMPIDNKEKRIVHLTAEIHYHYAVTVYDTKRDIGEAITHMDIAKKKYYSIGEEELGDDCLAHIKKYRNDL